MYMMVFAKHYSSAEFFKYDFVDPNIVKLQPILLYY